MNILERADETLHQYFSLISSEKLTAQQSFLDKKLIENIRYIVALWIIEFDKMEIQERAKDNSRI